MERQSSDLLGEGWVTQRPQVGDRCVVHTEHSEQRLGRERCHYRTAVQRLRLENTQKRSTIVLTEGDSLP